MAKNFLDQEMINVIYSMDKIEKDNIYIQIGAFCIIMFFAWILSAYNAIILIKKGSFYRDRTLRYIGYLSTFPTLIIATNSIHDYIAQNDGHKELEKDMLVVIIVYALCVIIVFFALMWYMFVSYIFIKKGNYYKDNTLLYTGYAIVVPTTLLLMDFTFGTYGLYYSQ
jgi:hypothetical protein